VCATDELAAGVYGAARDLGLTIGRDVALTGWDDIPVGRALTIEVWGMGAEGEAMSILADMFTEEYPDVT
jgi:DNA-binding LacI/PurR family transcriptional regulator